MKRIHLKVRHTTLGAGFDDPYWWVGALQKIAKRHGCTKRMMGHHGYTSRRNSRNYVDSKSTTRNPKTITVAVHKLNPRTRQYSVIHETYEVVL